MVQEVRMEIDHHGDGNQLTEAEISLIKIQSGEAEYAHHGINIQHRGKHTDIPIPNLAQGVKPNEKRDWMLFIRPVQFQVKENEQ